MENRKNSTIQYRFACLVGRWLAAAGILGIVRTYRREQAPALQRFPLPSRPYKCVYCASCNHVHRNDALCLYRSTVEHSPGILECFHFLFDNTLNSCGAQCAPLQLDRQTVLVPLALKCRPNTGSFSLSVFGRCFCLFVRRSCHCSYCFYTSSFLRLMA